jgi:hypothetical protein
MTDLLNCNTLADPLQMFGAGFPSLEISANPNNW